MEPLEQQVADLLSRNAAQRAVNAGARPSDREVVALTAYAAAYDAVLMVRDAVGIEAAHYTPGTAWREARRRYAADPERNAFRAGARWQATGR